MVDKFNTRWEQAINKFNVPPFKLTQYIMSAWARRLQKVVTGSTSAGANLNGGMQPIDVENEIAIIDIFNRDRS